MSHVLARGGPNRSALFLLLRWNKPQYDQRWDNYMKGITKPASYPSNGKLMQQQAHWQQVACLVYSDS